MSRYIEIDPEHIQDNKIKQAVDTLKKGGIIVYPTDTVYALGCDAFNTKAVERLCQLKGVKSEKTKFSIICDTISMIADYSKQIDNHVFKVMKKALPGPYTFILNASNKVPKLLQLKKKTIGIRIPSHPIPLKIVQELGNPIITTSIKDDDEVIEYSTDPWLIYERYENRVDIVIDAGTGNNEASTVIDCTEDDFTIVREGLGDIHQYI